MMLCVMLLCGCAAAWATTYPINIQSVTGGTVVADKAAAAIGETVTLTVTPNAGYMTDAVTVVAGYEVQGGSGGARAPRRAGVWYGQGSITVTQVDDTHYTFTLPTELPNVLTPNYVSNTEFKVSATFVADPNAPKYEITYEDITGGTVLADVAEAVAGQTVTLTITPDEGNTLTKLGVISMIYSTIDNPDDVWAPRRSPSEYDDFHYPLSWFKQETLTLTEVDESHYTFVMPQPYQDYDGYKVRVGATFQGAEPTKYAVNVTQRDNGTTSVDKAQAAEGETVTITATPNAGYQVDAAYACWFPNAGMFSMETALTLTQVDATHYTFVMPAGAATVRVTYKEGEAATTYPINIQPMSNGTVTADKAAAAIGETVTLTVTPNEGYEVSAVTVIAGYVPVIDDDDDDYAPRREPAVTFISQGEVSVTQTGDNTYAFVLPENFPGAFTENYVDDTEFRVSATFAELPPVESMVTFTAEQENGSMAVTVNGTPIESGATIAEGTTVTVVLTPAEGYKVASFTVETVDEQPAPGLRRASVPVTDEGENTYSFQMPGAPITMNAEFTENIITAISDLNAASGKVTYVNAMGQTSTRPFNGVNIMVKDGKAIGKLVK